MGLRGIQAWIFSFNPPNGWMDNLRFYGVFLFNIIQDISRRLEEDNIKLCAMEPLFDLYMHFMYKVRGRKLVCVCWRGEGRDGMRTPRL